MTYYYAKNGRRPLYMAVTRDKYELPLAVGASISELARMMGVHDAAVHKGCLRHEAGKKSIYVRIWYEEEDYDEMDLQ